MSGRVRVKICGITRVDDARIAAASGADAIGVIFAPHSMRRVSRERAAEIISTLPPFVTPVGVFVNARHEEILATIEATGIRAVQLHGDETPEAAAGFPVPVIKAFRVGHGFSPDALSPYRVNAYLLDTAVPGAFGGTGVPFDWTLARGALRHGPVVLSGGLKPDNVLEALRVLQPFAIDVSSGVESAPGEKDARQIDLLCERVRSFVKETPC